MSSDKFFIPHQRWIDLRGKKHFFPGIHSTDHFDTYEQLEEAVARWFQEYEAARELTSDDAILRREALEEEERIKEHIRAAEDVERHIEDNIQVLLWYQKRFTEFEAYKKRLSQETASPIFYNTLEREILYLHKQYQKFANTFIQNFGDKIFQQTQNSFLPQRQKVYDSALQTMELDPMFDHLWTDVNHDNFDF